MKRNQNSPTEISATITLITSLGVSISILWGLIFVSPESAYQIMKNELDSMVLCPKWPAELAGQIYSYLNVDKWAQLWLDSGRVSGVRNPIETMMINWMAERFEVWRFVLYAFLSRFSYAFYWLIVFSPAALISLCCGYFQREMQKGQFFFTSPFRMGLCTLSFKFCLCTLLMALCMPLPVDMWIFALLTGLMSLSSGLFVKHLQKEL